MKDKKIRRAERYFDLNGVIHVVIFSSKEMIKLMPIKDDSIIDVLEVEDFKNQINLLKLTEIPNPTIDRSNVSEHLLEFQFNLIGKTMANTVENHNWKIEWKLTKKQKEIFKSYALALLKKVFRFNSIKADATYDFFNQNFGI